MKSQEYLITILGNNERKLLQVTYEDGLFQKMEIPPGETNTPEQISWFHNFMRSQTTEQALVDNQRDASFIVKFRLTKVDPNIEFDTFWNAYDYKTSNKQRATKLWKNLSKVQKAQAIAALKQYTYYLSLNPSIEKKYADTYLYQRAWENEYKI